MNKRLIGQLIAVILLSLSALGQNDPNAASAVNSITMAIMDFESKAPGNPDLGSQISDILTARLSICDQYQLVERKKLNDLLEEHQLNLTGMVDSEQTVKIGKMLGARIMIFGKAFPVDRELYIVAKITGTETSVVKGVMAKGKLENDLSAILDQLVDKICTGMDEWSGQLLPQNEKYENTIALLKKQLQGQKLPKIAVMIPEMHINRHIIDPAAETETKKILLDTGFTVVDIDREKLSKWVKDFFADPNSKTFPDIASQADILVCGEGFSEYATRLNELYCCNARLEIKVLDKKENQVLLAQRTTKRGIDLSEAIAAKNALQAAGHEMAIKIIEKIAENIKKGKTAASPKI
jgi:hypothetical protein